MTAPAPGLRRRRLLLKLTVSSVLLLILLEIALRVVTVVDGDTGVARVVGTPLLPLRANAEVVSAWFEAQRDNRYLVLDSELGWCVGPDASGPLYNSDGRAVRVASGRQYPQLPAEGLVRIVTVGDSFTHGDEVADRDTWQAEVERLDPGVEALNLGVGGYGTDQALLRWRRDGAPRGGQIAVLGIWPENMCRNLNVCRFYMAIGTSFLTKPRFVDDGGSLRLINQPVAGPDLVARALAGEDESGFIAAERWRAPWEVEDRVWYGLRSLRLAASLYSKLARRGAINDMFSGVEPEGMAITVRIAQQFASEATSAGSRPYVLFLPMRELLATYPTKASFPLVKALQDAGLTVIDLTEVFHDGVVASGKDAIFWPSGHYRALANAMVAKELLAALATEIARIRGR